MLKMKLRNQKGFTLIEIIAVLVILGILAAVAIPKFMDLQTDAKNAAGSAALGAAAGNVQSAYAKLLVKGSATDATSVNSELNDGAKNYTNVGDYIVGYAVGTGSGSIDITLSTGSLGKFGSPSVKNVPYSN